MGRHRDDAARRKTDRLCGFCALAGFQRRGYEAPIEWESLGAAVNRFLAIACSVLLAMSVAGCVGKGKAPIGKGKAPVPPVVTKG